MLNKIIMKGPFQKTAVSVFLLAVMFFLFFSADPSLAADIKVIPSAAKVSPGEKLYIDVVVDNIPPEGLGAIQFRLNVNAPGSTVVSVSDTTLAGTGEISVATPLIIGTPVPNRSAIGDFFLNAAGPNGILVLDNEDLKNGTALYTFGHTNGAVPPQGSGSVAKFSFAVGKDVSAEKIDITLSEIMLLNAGTQYPVSNNTGATIEFGCMAKVPNLSGLSRNDAQAALENAGLSVGNIQEIDNWNGTYALNKILSQSYAAGASIPCGTPVDLTINIAPSEVSNATATDKTGDENGTVVISWVPSASVDTSGYRIYLVSGAQSLLKEIRDPSANGLEITSLTNGLPSQLRITAFDNFGNESQGVFVSAMPLDDVPPRVFIAGVAESTFYKSDIVPVITVEDANLSTKEITLDGTLYNLSPIINDGNHILKVVAKDTADNTTTKEIHFVIDKTAPVLTLSTLSDGAWTNNNLLNVAGTVTDNAGIQQLTINGTVVTINVDGSFSYPINLQDGPNDISAVAADLAGNEASDTRTVNLDLNVPVITITSPADNMKTKQTPIDVTGGVDDQSTVTVSLNGDTPFPAVMNGNNFSFPITPVYGTNTLEVTATDLAGNTSTAKRTVTFDDRNPSLSITDPPEDVKTNQANMTIKGETSDITAVTVTLTMDANTYTPVVTDGKFEQPVTFTTETTYRIYVTATNEVGNETTVQRNIVYDITSPALTIDPVTSPTNLNSQALTGAMEEGATVSVTCATGTPGTVAYPSTTTWTVTVSNMQEGADSITVIAGDEAGNTSQPVSASVMVDLTAPAASVSSPQSGGSYGTSVEIGAVATDALSRVSSVEYQLDGGEWVSLSLADPATGKYSTTWNSAAADQGPHTIYFRATDKAGNISQPVSVNFMIQIDNTPPVTTISIGAPEYNSYVTGGTVFTLSAIDDLSGLAKTEYAIDGGQFVAYAPFTIEAEGMHAIRYRSTDNAGNIEADKTLTVIADNTPPTGSVTINNNASYIGTSVVNLTISALDGAGSGVAKMCVSNTASCMAWENYAGTKAWTLSLGDGNKTVRVWFQDSLGNADSIPYSASITLDTTAPLLTVSTLSDGSWTNNELLNVSGEVTDNTGIQQCTINDAAVTINVDGSFSYPVNLRDGPNTISVIAMDLAGNEASETRTVNLDVGGPIITIDAPADNMKTKQTPIDVTGGVDDQSTVTVSLNGDTPFPAVMNGNNFSFPITPVYGINTLEVTATDLAGNTSAVKRTVTFDDRSPSLSVTGPAQDIRTDHADMVIKGETTDLTAVTITITMDENIYSPVATNGEFQQPVTFTEEKTYQIYVKAVDEAGNETIMQRNVVYDVTSCAITLDPVTSPTDLASQVLTGTMEAGATVSVTCLTATVGTVAYPTATTWTAALSNMQEGNNAITVIATDEAGNTSSPVLAVIVLSTNNSVADTSPAKLWIGLKNSDDQGTQFDLRTELYINGALISWGETRCITGVTRNASYAKEVTVPFNPVSNGTYASGDILSLKVFTRIGTTPDGQKCSGPGGSHNNAVGLRMYYDAPDRPSGFGAEITPEPVEDLFLHSSGTSYFFDNVTPAGTAKYKDSSGVNYSGGNLWEEIGTWTMVLQ